MFSKIKLGHIINAALIGFVLLMIFSPDTKAWVSQGLMKIGFFKPNLEQPAEKVSEAETVNEVADVAENELTNNQPPVYFIDNKGQEVDAANLKGKVVFMNFWATWCPPCIAEMPSIEKLYNKFKDNDQVVFLLVDVDNQMISAEQFMVKRKLNLPVHVAKSAIPGQWLGNSIPTTVILDKNGKIAAKHEGMADYGRKEVFDFITELINE